MKIENNIKTLSLGLVLLPLLAGCSAADRLANIGEAPSMSRIENPANEKQYRSVSMPMPEIKEAKPEMNSLWASSSRQTFFDDQRADNVGDILTVMIDIKDEAQIDNQTERSRAATEDASLGALLGYEQALNRVLPQAIDNTNLIDGTSTSRTTGSGSIDREEEITMTLAATVTQILPNGNMLIQGHQEVRVNFEKRILELAGIIRPEDITVDNSISYDKIAEARISYGGKGHISDVQQPRYGQQVYDVLFPF